MSFTVDFKIIDLFLDTRQIETGVNRAGLKQLANLGGVIRKIARNSLRRRKTSAMPGEPPHIHADSKVGQTKTTVRTKTGRTKVQKSGGSRNQVSLKNILYGVDRAALSMICGPVGLNQKVGGLTVPELMEKGGEVPRREARVGQNWRPVGRSTFGRETRVRTLHYAPHPFMGPALDTARETRPDLWTLNLQT